MVVGEIVSNVQFFNEVVGKKGCEGPAAKAAVAHGFLRLFVGVVQVRNIPTKMI